MKMKLAIYCLIMSFSSLAAGKDVAAIMSFSDTSDQQGFHANRGKESGLVHGLMENLSVRLMKCFRIVEREKFEDLARHLKISASGMITEETRQQIGRMTGAKYLLTGSVTENAMREKKFSGHGIKTNFRTHRLVIVFKLLNIQSGELEHADEVIITSKSRVTSSGGETDTQAARSLARKASDKIAENIGNYLKKKQENGEKELRANTFVFSIVSEPSGAHVDIDGYNEGATPMKVRLKAGTHTFRVYQTGYEPWMTRVNVNRDRTLRAVLLKREGGKK